MINLDFSELAKLTDEALALRLDYLKAQKDSVSLQIAVLETRLFQLKSKLQLLESKERDVYSEKLIRKERKK